MRHIPDFSFTDFKGTPRKLSDFRGKYVLLDFWGTWCGPCLKEMPRLKEVYDKFRARNFEVIGMDNEVRWDDLKRIGTGRGDRAGEHAGPEAGLRLDTSPHRQH